MDIQEKSTTTVELSAFLSFEALTAALGEKKRWGILAELSDGEPLMVVEIAERIKRKPDLVSKHLAVLRKAGMVVTGQAGMYRIPKQFLPTPGRRIVDYGYCLLRLDTIKKSSP